jgi:hypothetical protein
METQQSESAGTEKPIADLVKGLNEVIEKKIDDKEEEKKTEAEAFSSYDMIGKERTMQLGMKSKQANNSRQTSGNVAPFSLSTLFSSPLTFSSF